MRKCLAFLYLIAYSFGAIADDLGLPNTSGVEVPGKTKDQLLSAAQQCIKNNLKNDQFASNQDPSSLPDPTALVDSDEANGSVSGRHIFTVSGLFSAGLIKADILIEVKDGKYRITWHDVLYTAPIPVNWKHADLTPLIKAALPYNKAISALTSTTDSLKSCMSAPPKKNDNW